MVKISVVVPVYKVEDYLADCLDSIINQTFEDIEIICINDGSPDNSLKILEEYAEKDSRITVYSQENGGHAVATNRGISMATGDYLFLMDSDDVLELNALELSYNKAVKNDVDFVIFKAINYNHARDEYYETEVYSMDKVYKKVGDSVFNYKDLGELIFEMSVTPWSKLYKRKFIVDNNIIFPEGLIFEDNVFFYDALLTAERLCFLDEFLFVRRWYSTSSTTAGDLRFLNSIDVANLVIKTFEKHGEYENFKKQLWDFKIKNNFMRFRKIKLAYRETFFKELKKDLMKVLNDEKYSKDVMENLTYTYKKMYQTFLVSTSSFEYDYIRHTYSYRMKTNNLVKKFDYNKLVSSLNYNFFKSTPNRKEASFFAMKNFVHEIYSDNHYEAFLNKLNKNNRIIIQQIALASTSFEYEMIRQLYNNRNRIQKIESKKQELIVERDSLKEFNDGLKSSNSMKLANKLKLH